MYQAINNMDVFLNLVNQLSHKAKQDYKSSKEITWPKTIDQQTLWMTPQLLSIYGTEWMEILDHSTIINLSHKESVNFYSLNVHGIKKLLIDVIHRMYSKNYLEFSEFLHHFIAEENQHMRYFAEFCLRYGNKIYPSMFPENWGISADISEEAIEFILFARILIFEELVDFYNTTMARDITLPDIVREINKIHHNDEARHIAFGRKMVLYLFQKLSPNHQLHCEIEKYLKKYLRYCLNCFYNPKVYQDVNILQPLDLRQSLVTSSKRHEIEYFMLKRTINFLLRADIFTSDTWVLN